MKKLIISICSIIIFISSIMLYGTLASKEVLKKDLSTSVVEGLDLLNPIDNVLRKIGISEQEIANINAEMKPTLKDMKTKIINSEEYNEIIDKYSDVILNDLSQENSVYPNIDNDVRDLIAQNEAQISTSLKDYVSESDTKRVIDNIKDNVNLQSTYINLISKMKENTSPTQTKIIEVINFFNHDATLFIILGVLIGASVIIIILKRSCYSWSLPIGIPILIAGIALMMTSKLSTMFYSMNFQQDHSMINIFVDCIGNRMFHFGFIYFVLAIILFVFYFGFNKIKAD